MHRLKSVDIPTIKIGTQIKRHDARETAFERAIRGDYGSTAQQQMVRFLSKEPLCAAQIDIIRQLADIKNNEVASAKAEIIQDRTVLSRHIKRVGYFLGADIVGICRIPEYSFYSHDRQGNRINSDYSFAVLIIAGKEYKTVRAAEGHSWIGNAISFQAYMPTAFISHIIANYIRRLGYRASPQHAGLSPQRQYHVVIPPLLLWAGIGEMSRAGIVLNPFLGLNFKASAVLTDMPLQNDQPINFGLQDFCRRCRKCAELCPSRAIPFGDKVIYNDYETWKIHERRCLCFSLTNHNITICNNCVKVCPWTQPNTWPHNLIRRAVRNSSIARQIAITANRLFQHKMDSSIEEEKWWLSLEESDGVLKTRHSQENGLASTFEVQK